MIIPHEVLDEELLEEAVARNELQKVFVLQKSAFTVLLGLHCSCPSTSKEYRNLTKEVALLQALSSDVVFTRFFVSIFLNVLLLLSHIKHQRFYFVVTGYNKVHFRFFLKLIELIKD